MLRWIFLDVGNVVMNDDPVMAYLYEELARELKRAGVDLPDAELLAEREEVIRIHGTGHWSVLTERYLGPEGLTRLMKSSADHLRHNYLTYHNVLPGMEDALAELSREFSLGIVANQMREAETALEQCGLTRYFDFLGLSETIGRHKPEPAIFEWALEQAGCRPEEAVMVGDRIDNDIVPARTLGIRTIWFHAPLEEKGYGPTEGFRHLYFESQKRASIASIGPLGPEQMPDAEARSAPELVDAVYRLAGRERPSP